ncbi:Hsp20/alpha crystallin family protein [Cupriavidus gilardii]|uniref:Hsp20/alpha crystallin family protein n=1 Tax=Cupriavidus gilardii TaxID=82541 RepID=UPI00157433D9|nr:Hsp20/alpha crystallin family protein [Cupriavidus gilardii]MCG5259472.1 Hsp20/alpha crystallin family protein [Cupriavidus gilardii]MDF9429630.1 Hsp20/alpha crystallin family protein [Cupriavidus gilardii]NSX05368.1 Hsp20/alpha crystallin family protein [Cupriavidus gilardii]
MYASLLSSPGSLFAEFDRLQRELQQVFSTPSSIRAVARGAFPAVNIGMTPSSVEVYAFAPGIDPSTLDVSVDRGLLTIAGQRTAQTERSGQPTDQQAGQGQAAAGTSTLGDDTNVYVRERFYGTFRRVISLPEDVDTARIDATYRDGLLRISIARQESAQPRRITVN